MTLLLISRLLLAQEPCLPTDITDLTVQAGAQLRDEDFTGALETIARAEVSIPCANSHLWPYQLSMLYQTRAAAVARTEGEAAAREWYDDAIRMAPTVPFDPTLYPGGRRQFSAALDASRRTPTVLVSAPSGAILDGVLIPPGSSREVPQGGHVVQYLLPDGSLVTETRELLSDTAVGLPAELPAPPPPTERALPRHVGVGLVAAGGVLLGSSAYWQRRAGEHTVAGLEDADAVSRTANILTTAGLGTIAVGAGTLIVVDRRTGGVSISLRVIR